MTKQLPWYEGPISEAQGWAMMAELLPHIRQGELGWATDTFKWFWAEYEKGEAADTQLMRSVGDCLERIYCDGAGELKPDVHLGFCCSAEVELRATPSDDERVLAFLGPVTRETIEGLLSEFRAHAERREGS